MSAIPLAALDLAPIGSGSDAATAIADSLDLVQHLDRLGYHRLWYAEHHTAAGVASTSPAVLAALAAERTRRIRLGSGAVLLASTSPALALEQFATIARAHPGRVDLGLGRAHQPPATDKDQQSESGPGGDAKTAPVRNHRGGADQERTIDGVVIPAAPPFSFDDPDRRARFLAQREVIGARAEIGDYYQELSVVLDLLAGGRQTSAGLRISSSVAAGADLDVFALASSGGQSARAAGELGLPLAANYHVSPASVLETVTAYRDAFRPGVLAEPYVMVSADVLAASESGRAQHLAAGYDLWVLSIRAGEGAIVYPTPEEAAQHPWTESERELVRDRTSSRLVGSPTEVGVGLRALARVTGADELLLTTATHDPQARLDSYALIAQEWGLEPSTPANQETP